MKPSIHAGSRRVFPLLFYYSVKNIYEETISKNSKFPSFCLNSHACLRSWRCFVSLISKPQNNGKIHPKPPTTRMPIGFALFCAHRIIQKKRNNAVLSLHNNALSQLDIQDSLWYSRGSTRENML